MKKLKAPIAFFSGDADEGVRAPSKSRPDLSATLLSVKEIEPFQIIKENMRIDQLM